MTAQQTERVDPPSSGPGAVQTASTKSSGKAYDRRIRRLAQVRGSRLTRTGSPIAAALTRVPFVALVLVLLAGGVVGVLYLNTVSDAAGLRASQSRLAQMDLDTRIEAANKTIAAMKDPANLAAEAKALGLVPPGDAAMIQIGSDGKVTVIGTPIAVPGRGAVAPAAAPTAAAVQATAVVIASQSARNSTPSALPATPPTAAAPTAAAPTAAAPRATAPRSVAPTSVAPTSVAPTSAAPRATAPRSVAPGSTAPKPAAPAGTGARR